MIMTHWTLKLSQRLLFVVLLIMTACSSVTPERHLEDWNKTEFASNRYITRSFILQGYEKITRQRDKIVIYIEGDGHAWVSKRQASTDPTPVEPLVQNWARRDPRANVAYLARPCQFIGTFTPPCEMAYWTQKRFAPEVIASMNEAIEQIKTHAHASEIILIGYSGGGAVATLIAARRSDVSQLITVAGNLDTAHHSVLHGVSPLEGSLNPIDIAPQLGQIPQIHYVGGQDRNIPRTIADHFVRNLPHSQTARIVEIPDATHQNGWDQLDFSAIP